LIFLLFFYIIVQSKKTTCKFDPIPTKLFNDLNILSVLSEIATHVINKSFSQGKFPDSEKIAIVYPLKKSKLVDSEVLSNYRPISNVTFLSKLIERSVSVQLTNHLERYDLLSNFQSSYRSLYSTETAILRINNDLIEFMSQKKCVLLIMLDLSAAFDTVNHQILLNDLISIGINGTELSWFKSYLSERKQAICFNNKMSKLYDIKYGVPQGSVLGPLLFLIYTRTLKDIFDSNDVKYHLYADDTQFYIPFNPDESQEAIEKITLLIDEISRWMNSRFLKLNESKTEILVIGDKRNLCKTNLNGKMIKIGMNEITIKESVRNIGCNFDNNLHMDCQINKVVRNTNIQLRKMYKIRKYITQDVAVVLTQALITSVIDYQNVVLYNLPSRSLKPLQLCLNRCVRLIFKLKRCISTKPYMKRLKWLPIKGRLEYKILVLIQKALIFKKPSYLYNLVDYAEPNKHFYLRRNVETFNLNMEYPRNNLENRIFRIYAPKLYNSVPMSIRNLNNIDIFKKRVKEFLLKIYLEE